MHTKTSKGRIVTGSGTLDEFTENIYSTQDSDPNPLKFRLVMEQISRMISTTIICVEEGRARRRYCDS